MMRIHIIFYFIAYCYSKHLTSFKHTSKRHSIASRTSMSHKSTRFTVYHSVARRTGSSYYEKSRHKTGKSTKRSVTRKLVSKAERIRRLSNVGTNNVKMLKLVLLYALGVIKKHSSNYEKLVSRHGNLRSGVSKYVRLRDKITKVAKLLNDMDWKDTTSSNTTSSNHNETQKGSFYMSPTKFNNLLTSLGTGKFWLKPRKKLREHQKKNATISDNGIEGNTHGDTDYDFLTSQNEENTGHVDIKGRSETDSFAPQSGEEQVADILEKLHTFFASNETQSSKDQLSNQNENSYLSPAKFNSLLESLGSDQWSTNMSPDTTPDTSNTSFVADITESLNNNNASNSNDGANIGNSSKSSLSNATTSNATTSNATTSNATTSNATTSNATTSNAANVSNKSDNLNSSTANNVSNKHNIEKVANSSTTNNVTTSSDAKDVANGTIPSIKSNKGNITYAITNTIARFATLLESLGSDDWAWNITDSNVNNATKSNNTADDVTYHTGINNTTNSTAKDSMTNSFNTRAKANVTDSSNTSALNGSKESHENSSITVSKLKNNTSDDVDASRNHSKRITVEVNTDGSLNARSKDTSRDDIDSILATLSNSNSNDTSAMEEEVNNDNGNNNDRNKQVNLSIILKYERLLKLLHSKLSSAEGWKQNTFLNLSVAKFEKLLDSLTTELISDDLGKEKGDNNKQDDENEKQNVASGVTGKQNVEDKLEALYNKNNNKKNNDNNNNDNDNNDNNNDNNTTQDGTSATPSSSSTTPDDSPDEAKVDYVSKLVENTQKFHASTLIKFKKLIHLISFKNLVRNLPHMRIDEGASKHLDYYSFNEKFIKKMDNLMKMLAFNRIFDDTSSTRKYEEEEIDSKKHTRISEYHSNENTKEKWHWRIV